MRGHRVRTGRSMTNRWKLVVVLALFAVASVPAYGQEPAIAPGENLVVDGVPAIPATLVDSAGRYSSYRGATLADWHPSRREMLIATRFGDTPQLHLVKMPGRERQQLTFFADAVGNGTFHPNGGDYIVFSKDVGGGEWFQLYRYDVTTGDMTLLTDGKSRNLRGPWSSRGDQIAYMSTRRTGKDTDLWVMNPADPKSDHLLTQLAGGGWQPQDWSPDDKKILLTEEISINESLSVAGGHNHRSQDRADAARRKRRRFFTVLRNSARTARASTSPRTRIPSFNGCPISIWRRSIPNF